MYKINTDMRNVIYINGKWRLLYYTHIYSTWKVVIDGDVFDIEPSLEYSAYYIRTYANYKSYICELLDITNNIAALNPSLEYQAMSGDHAMHGYDPQLYVAENELKDIWEERKPIEGFKFDVEPIVYLKKEGVWLVKE